MSGEGRSAAELRLAEHRRIWERKRVLAGIYGVWFEALLARLPPAGRILEVGAGPGFLAEHARRRLPRARWVAMDITKTGWNDLVGDGLRLPFRSGALDAVAVLDLIHHLARPALFFAEAARVLAPGGLVAAVEPWITPLSYPVYRCFHHERCRLGVDPWNPFGAGDGPSKDAFDGDAAVVWRLVRTTPESRWRELGFGPPRATVLNGFAYLFSLGFRPPSLLPRRLAPLLLALDRRASPLAPLVGLRVLAIWDRDA